MDMDKFVADIEAKGKPFIVGAGVDDHSHDPINAVDKDGNIRPREDVVDVDAIEAESKRVD